MRRVQQQALVLGIHWGELEVTGFALHVHELPQEFR